MERREHQRFEVQVIVDVRGVSDGAVVAATMGNVSEGGAFLRLAQRPSRGSRISILIPRPGAEEVAVGAIVSRVALNGVGVAWDVGDDKQQGIVDALVIEADQSD